MRTELLQFIALKCFRAASLSKRCRTSSEQPDRRPLGCSFGRIACVVRLSSSNGLYLWESLGFLWYLFFMIVEEEVRTPIGVRLLNTSAGLRGGNQM